MARRTLLALLPLLLLFGCARPYERTAKTLGLPKDAVSAAEGRAVLEGNGHRFEFPAGIRVATVDGTRYYLNHAAGQDELAEADAALLRAAVVDPAPLRPRPAILLDPGHGGKDIGCSVGKNAEHAIAHDVALAAQALLQAAGCDVRLTRAADQGPTLQERVDLAAANPPDAYVSIHVNAAANPEARGVEVYTLPLPGCDGTNANAKAWETPLPGQAHLPQATRLALCVQRALLRAPGNPEDRGVRHAHFKVLRDVPAPAILIETGFVTNAGDRARLASPEGRRTLGFAIALGVLDAFRR